MHFYSAQLLWAYFSIFSIARVECLPHLSQSYCCLNSEDARSAFDYALWNTLPYNCHQIACVNIYNFRTATMNPKSFETHKRHESQFIRIRNTTYRIILHFFFDSETISLSLYPYGASALDKNSDTLTFYWTNKLKDRIEVNICHWINIQYIILSLLWWYTKYCVIC